MLRRGKRGVRRERIVMAPQPDRRSHFASAALELTHIGVRRSRIGVGGFKSIKKLQALDLRPTNILIGSNGAGKSNLISFLNLLRAIADGTLQESVGRAGGETLLYYGAKETPAMWATLEFTGKTGDGSYTFWLAATDTDTLVFSKEQAIYARTRGSYRQPKQLGSGHKESLLMADENQFLEIWELLAGIQIFHFTTRRKQLTSASTGTLRTIATCETTPVIWQPSCTV